MTHDEACILNENINKLIRRHPALREVALGQDHGFSLPNFEDPIIINLDESGPEGVKSYGISITTTVGRNNKVVVDTGMPPIHLSLDLIHATDCIIIIEGGSQISKSLIKMQRSGHLFYCGKNSKGPNQINASFYDSACALFLGSDVTSNGTKYHLQGTAKSICVGDDCMFSWDISIRGSDGHSVFDLDTKAILNSAQNILIGPHVWIAFGCVVQKGVEIGAGSVVGAQSIVTKTIPSCCIAVGAPAVIKRTRASWSRKESPNAYELDQVLNLGFIKNVLPT